MPEGDTATFRTLLSNRVRAIDADAQETWVATDAGVSRWSQKTGTWSHFTDTDGLAGRAVNDVAIDRPWVWFATEEGVSRYDTRIQEWKTYRKEQGLASNYVITIAVDGSYVWFGTDSGLNRYDKAIDSWAVRTKQDGLISNMVRTIAVDNDYVWIGTGFERQRWGQSQNRDRPSRGGISRYHRATDSWNQYDRQDGLIDNEITTIAIDGPNVWFGTYDQGASLFNMVEQSFVRSYTQTDQLASNLVQSILADGTQVWIGTANAGVHRFIKSVNTWIHYTSEDGLASDHVSAIVSQGNYVWFGSADHGLSRYDKRHGHWTRYVKAEQLVDNDVRKLTRDRSNRLWIATANGLSRYDIQTQTWENFLTNNGLATNYLTDVITTGDDIWIGTDRGLGGLESSSGVWKFYQPHNGLKTGFVTAVASRDGTLWVGTNYGVYSLYRGENTWHHLDAQRVPHERVETLCSTDTGLWVGMHDAAVRYAPEANKTWSYALPHVNTVVNTSTGLWAGTRQGLWRYDTTHDTWQQVTQSLNVRSVFGRQGVLWLGTAQGLESYDVRAQIWKKHHDSMGSVIRNVCGCDAFLWLATATGLAQYDPETLSVVQWHRAPQEAKPLREQIVAHLEFDGDYVWMANWFRSVNGAIVRFHRPTGAWQRFTRQDILGSTDASAMTHIYEVRVESSAVWFTTDFGILQYDKLYDTWQHFTVDDGLASNETRDMVGTPEHLWVTASGGNQINQYDRSSGLWHILELPEDYPFTSVRTLAADELGVWIGLNTAIYLYQPQTQQWRTYGLRDGLATKGAEWIEVDPEYVWVAGRSGAKGLSRYDKRRDLWEVFSTNDVLASPRISRIMAGDDYVWIIYNSREEAGVSRFDRATGDWLTITPMGGGGSGVEEMATDNDYLWIGTEDDGIQRFHFASGTWAWFEMGEGLLSDHTTREGLKVDDQFVWIATPRGLSRYDKHTDTWDNFEMQPTLSGQEVRAVVAGARYVWCGTDNGLSRYDKYYDEWDSFHEFEWRPRWGRSMRDDNLVDDGIRALLLDSRYLWVATQNGANRYDYIAERWDEYRTRHGLPGDSVTAISSDGKNVWMGTTMGLGRYPQTSDDPNAWVSFTSGADIRASVSSSEYAATLVANEVWSVSANKRAVWVGTRLGASRYDLRKGTWQTYTETDGLPSREISCIEVAADVVWFGSDQGAAIYDAENQRWQTYTTEDGLPDNRITAIRRDGTSVWFGTYDSGAAKLDLSSGEWSYYTSVDGLAHNGILSMAVDGDLIWFGTHRGLSRFDKASNTWTTFTERHGPEDLVRLPAYTVAQNE